MLNTLRKRININYNSKVNKQSKSKSEKRLQIKLRKTKQQYTKKQAEFNKKFNERFNPNKHKSMPKRNHRYPTRKSLQPCEEYNQTTIHNDIRLEWNNTTGKMAALDGFFTTCIFSMGRQTTKNAGI